MYNRIDSTTELLKRMFLWCRASNETIVRYSETDVKSCKMCNNCKIIEQEENYTIFEFGFENERLMYKFDFKKEPLRGQQQVVGITFIGFNE